MVKRMIVKDDFSGVYVHYTPYYRGAVDPDPRGFFCYNSDLVSDEDAFTRFYQCIVKANTDRIEELQEDLAKLRKLTYQLDNR